MLEKTRENETVIDFKKTPIGKIDGEQVDLKQFEINKSTEKEYRNIRNNIIVELHKINLKYSEISNLKVQDIDKSFALIRIQRGDRVFRIAISPQITNGLKELIKYKSDKDYIFTKKIVDEKPISRTMVTKIIQKHKTIDINHKDIRKKMYKVERVCDKYVIYKNGRVIDGLVINKITNALRICDVLNED